jgi:hypothetical protein
VPPAPPLVRRRLHPRHFQSRSVFWRILPAKIFLTDGHSLAIVFGGLGTVALVSFLAAAVYFEKKALLPTAVPIILTMWIGAFGFILHRIAFEISFADFGGLIYGGE